MARFLVNISTGVQLIDGSTIPPYNRTEFLQVRGWGRAGCCSWRTEWLNYKFEVTTSSGNSSCYTIGSSM